MDEIFGHIERITFHNPDTGYTVAKLQQPKKRSLTVIVGNLPSVQPGETVRCKGEWKNHLVHGRQFVVDNYKIETPADVRGIKKYLGSGLIKGIGPKYAERIVDHFGEDTLNVIDIDPKRLIEVEGIGKKRVSKIISCWDDQRTIREVMIFLQNFGVSPTYAQKIFKVYGKECINKLNDNPYCLAKDIFGIGFRTADGIARKMGFEKTSARRIESGIEYVLSQLSNDGHVCHPIPTFLEESEQVLEVEQSLIEGSVDTLIQENRIVVYEMVHDGKTQTFIWVRPLFLSEKGIAHELKRLTRNPCSLREVNADKAVEWVQEKLHLELAEKQKVAVTKSLTEKVHIITGGPGTGKSTITNAIITITQALTQEIMLAAPTGRAAKRMTEITGRKASTIHSLLEFDFRAGGFKRNNNNPLQCDLLIVDEASMIDTLLMYSLLKAIPSHARVIFVGDIHQLPSVGPGNVLKDIIASKCIPVTLLNEIFRQAAGSQIITNSHSINQGKFPDIRNSRNSDFFFIEANEKEDVLDQIVSLLETRIPKKYDFDPLKEIQVLSPMKRGVVGTENLNTVLQGVLNKKDQCIYQAGKKLQVGDKVMQIKNNYDKEVFNGDVGYIHKIDSLDQMVLIDYDDRLVEYDFSDLDEIVHAYAVSIHKYQGSECPCIIIPIHTTHFKMLHRNLFYTGVTRGKKLVIIVGTKKAITIAVNNDEVKKRYTGLQQSITELNSPIRL
ncbi:MAG: ATP-dependent RecD-like DNA helicase [Chlamydiota bacterium]